MSIRLFETITNSLALKFYNHELSINVSCDASMRGLGVVLEQKYHNIWHPVCYPSRFLTSTEENYCRFQKDVRSIVFVCDKLHEFIYGKQFEVYNDNLHLNFQ